MSQNISSAAVTVMIDALSVRNTICMPIIKIQIIFQDFDTPMIFWKTCFYKANLVFKKIDRRQKHRHYPLCRYEGQSKITESWLISFYRIGSLG